ncbi:PHP domain-containing protein [Celerinatantimonas yamalensis]|uniref:PHP domain-containing protein n=1 Tax=Celerinatantimonas yamalensis TaxID=559956 RepID=A0ABW9G317_9GAMM
MKIDLHCHTTASDGGLTPKELVLRAENMQVDYLAITDHDTTAAIEPARQAAKRVQIIEGVEISTQWQGFDIHIVGLGFALEHQVLQNALHEQRLKRDSRAREISIRLAKRGIEPVYADALTLAQGGSVTRAHIAQVLVNRGKVKSFTQVFNQYMTRGKPGYVPNQWMSMAQAVALLHQAGGVAVLAHPLNYQLSNKWVRRLVSEFADVGGDAIEVGMPQLKPDHQRWLVDLANQHQLLASVGSDFHRPMPWRELGRYLALPETVSPVWQQFLPDYDIKTKGECHESIFSGSSREPAVSINESSCRHHS